MTSDCYYLDDRSHGAVAFTRQLVLPDDFWYLFPELIVLLQQSQGSGLKASQQDFEFFLQFCCFPGLCGHVAPVYLPNHRAESENLWKLTRDQSSVQSCDIPPAFSLNFRYGLSSTPGWLGCTCSESADTKPAEKERKDDSRFSGCFS